MILKTNDIEATTIDGAAKEKEDRKKACLIMHTNTLKTLEEELKDKVYMKDDMEKFNQTEGEWETEMKIEIRKVKMQIEELK